MAAECHNYWPVTVPLHYPSLLVQRQGCTFTPRPLPRLKSPSHRCPHPGPHRYLLSALGWHSWAGWLRQKSQGPAQAFLLKPPCPQFIKWLQSFYWAECSAQGSTPARARRIHWPLLDHGPALITGVLHWQCVTSFLDPENPIWNISSKNPFDMKK